MASEMEEERKTVLHDVQGIIDRTRAPPNQFRLVMVDLWDAPYCSDFDLGAFGTLDEAIRAGEEQEKRNNPGGKHSYLRFYIYDDRAHWLGEVKNGQFNAGT